MYSAGTRPRQRLTRLPPARRCSRPYSASMLRRGVGVLLLALICSVLAVPGAFARSVPSLSVIGLKAGSIAGKSLPYTEIGSEVELSGAYRGPLSGGTKLELFVKDPGSGFKASKTPVRLSGGHAKLHVSYSGLGGPVVYELALVSKGGRLGVSRPVTVYYAQPPGGVFAGLQGDSASFTSRTDPSENCATPSASTPLCNGVGSGGQTTRVSAASNTAPVPPGWKVALVFNGHPVCSSESIEAKCEVELAFPEVGAATVIDLTATLTSPHGTEIVATRAITVYPG